ncbi:ribonuclease R [Bacillota bacterium LX-D]|nr:ribonuclease R [Bacillota bacterium LX-D]
MDREELLQYMQDSTYKPLTAEELVSNLEIKDVKTFLNLLKELEEEGFIVLTRKNKYGLTEKMGLIAGRVQGHPKGFAFLLADAPHISDIFISPEDLNGAMHNDRVLVRLNKKSAFNFKPEGEVIRILKRANQQIVGYFEKSKNFGFVVPDEKRIGHDIFVAIDDTKGAQNGDKVVVEITRWPEKRRNPEGRIVEVLGKAGAAGVDVLSIVRKYQLPEEFPPKVIQEAEEIPSTVSPESLENRRDLRNVPMVTIDGADAKDLDDAVSLSILENGNYLLGVHIADVSYYVREGSKLDQEAYNRATSVYLVDRVIPMLPPKLSNGICSLNAGVDRLAMSAQMEINPQGQVVKYDIFPSVIHIDERMTYDNVRKILEEKDEELSKRYAPFVVTFQNMAALANILKEKRLERGAVDFDFPESKVKLDQQGKPMEIVKRTRSVAEMIIEEFMLCANETVAQHMYWLEAPFVYRIHEEPDLDDLTDLNEFLHGLGYHLKFNDEIHPRAFQDIVAKVQGRPEEKVVSTVLLRTMKHAKYAPDCLGHFGLACPYYCHFTSPIRRYPDLVIHRVIKEYLENGEPNPKRLAKLEKLMPAYAEQSSLREKIAEDAERESVDLKKVEYMERYLGEIFPGVISSVTSFGLFVELDNTVEGLVHVSTLTDDYYQFLDKQLALLGEHTHKTYKIGDRVMVQVSKVNTLERQIDFELIGMAE